MKKYFITGLVILLPVALTIVVVAFFFNLFTDPFVGGVKAVFERYNLFTTGFLFLSASQLQIFLGKILVLMLIFAFTLGLGIIARWFFFNAIIDFTNYIVQKIPLVRSIYKTSQDVIQTIFTSDTRSFKQVVLVKFPNPATYSIGLVTREDIPAFSESGLKNTVAVFVPTTPNPTSGFLIMFDPAELIYLDMTVEDAFKYIISCGMILPAFKSMDHVGESKS